MAAPVTIAGRDYVCQIVVKQFKDRNQFYLHEVELKEKLPTEGRTGFYSGSTSGGANGLLAQKNGESQYFVERMLPFTVAETAATRRHSDYLTTYWEVYGGITKA